MVRRKSNENKMSSPERPLPIDREDDPFVAQNTTDSDDQVATRNTTRSDMTAQGDPDTEMTSDQESLPLLLSPAYIRPRMDRPVLGWRPQHLDPPPPYTIDPPLARHIHFTIHFHPVFHSNNPNDHGITGLPVFTEVDYNRSTPRRSSPEVSPRSQPQQLPSERVWVPATIGPRLTRLNHHYTMRPHNMEQQEQTGQNIPPQTESAARPGVLTKAIPGQEAETVVAYPSTTSETILAAQVTHASDAPGVTRRASLLPPRDGNAVVDLVSQVEELRQLHVEARAAADRARDAENVRLRLVADNEHLQNELARARIELRMNRARAMAAQRRSAS